MLTHLKICPLMAGLTEFSISDDLVDGLDELAVALDQPDLFAGDEMGGELFYDAALTGWFHLALDLQVTIRACANATRPCSSACALGWSSR